MENKFRSIGENERCQISELIRKAIGLRKKSDFAQLIGISLPMMSRLLNGKYCKKIPIDILQEIYKNRYNQSDTTLLQQLYLLNGYDVNSIKEVHKMKNLDELIKGALNYHLNQIEERMQEQVNKGEPYIYYQIPAFLLDDENFRKGLERELEAAEYIIEKSKYSSFKNHFKISCIEMIEDPIKEMEDTQEQGDLNND